MIPLGEVHPVGPPCPECYDRTGCDHVLTEGFVRSLIADHYALADERFEREQATR